MAEDAVIRIDADFGPADESLRAFVEEAGKLEVETTTGAKATSQPTSQGQRQAVAMFQQMTADIAKGRAATGRADAPATGTDPIVELNRHIQSLIRGIGDALTQLRNIGRQLEQQRIQKPAATTEGVFGGVVAGEVLGGAVGGAVISDVIQERGGGIGVDADTAGKELATQFNRSFSDSFDFASIDEFVTGFESALGDMTGAVVEFTETEIRTTKGLVVALQGATEAFEDAIAGSIPSGSSVPMDAEGELDVDLLQTVGAVVGNQVKEAMEPLARSIDQMAEATAVSSSMQQQIRAVTIEMNTRLANAHEQASALNTDLAATMETQAGRVVEGLRLVLSGMDRRGESLLPIGELLKDIGDNAERIGDVIQQLSEFRADFDRIVRQQTANMIGAISGSNDLLTEIRDILRGDDGTGPPAVTPDDTPPIKDAMIQIGAALNETLVAILDAVRGGGGIDAPPKVRDLAEPPPDLPSAEDLAALLGPGASVDVPKPPLDFHDAPEDVQDAFDQAPPGKPPPPNDESVASLNTQRDIIRRVDDTLQEMVDAIVRFGEEASEDMRTFAGDMGFASKEMREAAEDFDTAKLKNAFDELARIEIPNEIGKALFDDFQELLNDAAAKLDVTVPPPTFVEGGQVGEADFKRAEDAADVRQFADASRQALEEEGSQISRFAEDFGGSVDRIDTQLKQVVEDLHTMNVDIQNEAGTASDMFASVAKILEDLRGGALGTREEFDELQSNVHSASESVQRFAEVMELAEEIPTAMFGDLMALSAQLESSAREISEFLSNTDLETLGRREAEDAAIEQAIASESPTAPPPEQLATGGDASNASAKLAADMQEVGEAVSKIAQDFQDFEFGDVFVEFAEVADQFADEFGSAVSLIKDALFKAADELEDVAASGEREAAEALPVDLDAIKDAIGEIMSAASATGIAEGGQLADALTPIFDELTQAVIELVTAIGDSADSAGEMAQAALDDARSLSAGVEGAAAGISDFDIPTAQESDIEQAHHSQDQLRDALGRFMSANDAAPAASDLSDESLRGMLGGATPPPAEPPPVAGGVPDFDGNEIIRLLDTIATEMAALGRQALNVASDTSMLVRRADDIVAAIGDVTSALGDIDFEPQIDVSPEVHVEVGAAEVDLRDLDFSAVSDALTDMSSNLIDTLDKADTTAVFLIDKMDAVGGIAIEIRELLREISTATETATPTVELDTSESVEGLTGTIDECCDRIVAAIEENAGVDAVAVPGVEGSESVADAVRELQDVVASGQSELSDSLDRFADEARSSEAAGRGGGGGLLSRLLGGGVAGIAKRFLPILGVGGALSFAFKQLQKDADQLAENFEEQAKRLGQVSGPIAVGLAEVELSNFAAELKTTQAMQQEFRHQLSESAKQLRSESAIRALVVEARSGMVDERARLLREEIFRDLQSDLKEFESNFKITLVSFIDAFRDPLAKDIFVSAMEELKDDIKAQIKTEFETSFFRGIITSIVGSALLLLGGLAQDIVDPGGATQPGGRPIKSQAEIAEDIKERRKAAGREDNEFAPFRAIEPDKFVPVHPPLNENEMSRAVESGVSRANDREANRNQSYIPPELDEMFRQEMAATFGEAFA